MRDYDFETVDVFTNERFGGNPLAVVPDAAGLSDGQMQAIAREFNLSETTFVTPPANRAHTAAVRIFTPVTELPFAGHPNVGTAMVLAWHRSERPSGFVFEERAGLVSIEFAWGDSPRATLTAPLPLRRETDVDVEVAAASVGLAAAAVVTTSHAPCVAGVGTPFVIMEVTDAARRSANPDLAAMRRAAERFPVRPIGFPVLLYTRDGQTPNGRTLRARMFSPLSGIIEDPATGSAVAALAALLVALGGDDRGDFMVSQGEEMGRPSVLFATGFRTDGQVFATVGGNAVPVMHGKIRI